jgi:hypothetical protein
MDKRYISLAFAGEVYDYIYYPKTREVCTQIFPNVPVVRVNLGCGHSIDHDTLCKIVENQIKSLDVLSNSF